MKRVKSFSVFSIILIAILILLLPFWSGVKNQSKAAGTQSNECFQIEVFGRNGYKIENQSPKEYDNQKAFIFRWKDTGKFVFNVDPESYQPTAADSYTLQISIEYLKNYKEIEDFLHQASLITVENYEPFTRTSTGNLNGLINSPIELDIDKGVNTLDASGKRIVTFSGWGIYRFYMNINGGPNVYSDFFIIEPDKELLVKPDIAFNEVPPTDAPDLTYSNYNFYLKNKEKFTYIDETKLIWYATGVAQGGIEYALTNDGIQPLPPNYGQESNPSKNRVGLEFSFNDDGHHGDWTVWCEYQYFRSENPSITSNKIQLITSASANFNILIWIAVGVVPASILITILICWLKIRREKVY